MPNRHQMDGEPQMSDAEIERVATRVFEKLRAQIGDSALKVLVWAASIAFMGFLTWIGFIKNSHAAGLVFHIHK